MSDISDEAIQSALQENISRKGTNSYYYAHGKKIEGPAWDGKEQPRLLSCSPAPRVESKVFVTTLDSFSWLDEKKVVKVYVEFENANAIEDSDISLESDETSFTLRFTYDSKPHCLCVGPLSAEIEGATYQKKADKLVLRLHKKIESSWYQLKKAAV